MAGRPVASAGPDAKKIFVGMGKALARDRQDVIKRAAFRAKMAHLTELKKGTRTLRMRNVGPRGARVGIMYRTWTKGHAMAEGQVSATGPLHLLDRKTVAIPLSPDKVNELTQYAVPATVSEAWTEVHRAVIVG